MSSNKVADKDVEGIVGKEADTQLVPDTFLESIEMTEAKIVGPKHTDRRFPRLIEYQYQLPARAANGPNAGKIIRFKKAEKKTTYDPAKLSDAKVADMSNKAAKKAEDYFKINPEQRQYSVKIDGYWFRVTRDAKTGEINNAFLSISPRG
ncbi:CdiA family toxin C-terminal domain-containing protein [Gilliamella sp. Fer4-1]|uniref:CdiA family toxin C-terminal domain-containing protein n=1 Tax=Gilliamella sp. Fer4-1 TaxID=3120242 RepID=UPI00080DAA94|nr:CdiA family toxin C-terminal domain-containing protein [Gilliamella apicola]OCG61499.1 hypothetical protein A9G30_10450 [Gilliamella apicola]